MPVFNAEAYLAEAITSILGQTYDELELVIVDDGSSDGSPQVMAGYDDPRVRIIRTENRGEAAARTRGIAEAHGEFVAWQDADDVSLPTRLEVLMRQLELPHVGFAHSDMLLIDTAGAPCGYWQSQMIVPTRVERFLLRVGTPFNNPSMVLRRSIAAGIQYRSFRIGTDTDAVAQFAVDWHGVHVPEPLLLYRRHATSATADPTEETVYEHVASYLERTPLERLFPELDWTDGEGASRRAQALLCLFLYRRGFPQAAQRWLDQAQDQPPDEDVARFVEGVARLAVDDAAGARELLSGCRRDHVVENYLGEAAARGGDLARAILHFRQAATLAPHYPEPLANLKAVGARTGYMQLDPSWLKFR